MKKSTPPAPGYTLYTVKDLLELKDDPNIWIVKNMIPKAGRVVAYGHGGQYKSAICFDLAVAVASGGLLLEQIPIETYGPTLVLSTEGSLHTMRKRFLAHMRSRNAVPDSVKLYFGRKPLKLDTAADRKVLEQLIKATSPVLIIVDPYASFLKGDENDTAVAKALSDELNMVVEDSGATLLIIHHSRKDGDIRGSTALYDWADAVLKFKAKKNQQVPGIQGTRDIITVDAEKQRDGPGGTVFSAVPFINEKLGMITFGVYNGMDAKMVTTAKLKHDVLDFLRRTQAALPKSRLCDEFKVGREKMDIAIGWLARDKLIQEIDMTVDCGGGRQRRVTAWASAAIGSRVDAARAILRAERIEGDADAGVLH
jgi:hypothetical protein